MLKSGHGPSVVLMSANGAMVPWCHTHEYLWTFISTHKQPWAHMNMASWHQQHSWALMSINEHSAMTLIPHIAPWYHNYQCSWLFIRTHECPWTLLKANKCSWALLSDPEFLARATECLGSSVHLSVYSSVSVCVSIFQNSDKSTYILCTELRFGLEVVRTKVAYIKPPEKLGWAVTHSKF